MEGAVTNFVPTLRTDQSQAMRVRARAEGEDTRGHCSFESKK